MSPIWSVPSLSRTKRLILPEVKGNSSCLQTDTSFLLLLTQTETSTLPGSLVCQLQIISRWLYVSGKLRLIQNPWHFYSGFCSTLNYSPVFYPFLIFFHIPATIIFLKCKFLRPLLKIFSGFSFTSRKTQLLTN